MAISLSRGALVVATLLSWSAAANEPAAEHDYHLMAGALGTSLFALDESGHGVHGGGLFVEVTAFPHWLEVELAVRVVASEAVMPIDLLLKLPLHISESVHPFVGVGPALVIGLEDEGSAHAALAASLGLYWWLVAHVGVTAEVDYEMVFAHGAHHELGGSVGVVFGW